MDDERRQAENDAPPGGGKDRKGAAAPGAPRPRERGTIKGGDCTGEGGQDRCSTGGIRQGWGEIRERGDMSAETKEEALLDFDLHLIRKVSRGELTAKQALEQLRERDRQMEASK